MPDQIVQEFAAFSGLDASKRDPIVDEFAKFAGIEKPNSPVVFKNAEESNRAISEMPGPFSRAPRQNTTPRDPNAENIGQNQGVAGAPHMDENSVRTLEELSGNIAPTQKPTPESLLYPDQVREAKQRWLQEINKADRNGQYTGADVGGENDPIGLDLKVALHGIKHSAEGLVARAGEALGHYPKGTSQMIQAEQEGLRQAAADTHARMANDAKLHGQISGAVQAAGEYAAGGLPAFVASSGDKAAVEADTHNVTGTAKTQYVAGTMLQNALLGHVMNRLGLGPTAEGAIPAATAREAVMNAGKEIAQSIPTFATMNVMQKLNEKMTGIDPNATFTPEELGQTIVESFAQSGMLGTLGAVKHFAEMNPSAVKGMAEKPALSRPDAEKLGITERTSIDDRKAIHEQVKSVAEHLPTVSDSQEVKPGDPGTEAGQKNDAPPLNEPVSDNSKKSSSWVIRNKDTGEVLFETFNPAIPEKLNTAKYEAVPIRDYLVGLNEGRVYNWDTGKSEVSAPKTSDLNATRPETPVEQNNAPQAQETKPTAQPKEPGTLPEALRLHTQQPNPDDITQMGSMGTLPKSATDAVGKVWTNVKDAWKSSVLPNLTRSSPEAADSMAEHAASKIAAPHMADAMITDVYGAKEHEKPGVMGALRKKLGVPTIDRASQEKFDAVQMEDRLRGIADRQNAKANDPQLSPAEQQEAHGAAQKVHTLVHPEYGYFKSEAEYQAALHDPKIQEMIQKYEANVNPAFDEMYRTNKGLESDDPVPAQGRDTKMITNLRAIREGEAAPESKYFTGVERTGKEPSVPPPVSAKGDLTQPRRNYDVNANTEAMGNAPYGYHLNGPDSIRNSMNRRYVMATRIRAIDSLVKEGIGTYERPVDGMIKGERAVKFDDVKIPGEPQRTLWVPQSALAEVKHAMNMNDNLESVLPAHVINTLQMAVSPVDFIAHTGNLIRGSMASPGGKNFADNVLRLGLNMPDAIGRMGNAANDVLKNSPETAHELSRLAEIGALRGEGHSGGAGPLLNFIDKAGRLTQSRLFDSLVESGKVKDTASNRRDFINNASGQYNSRLATSEVGRILKEIRVLPFLTANVTFARSAAKELVGSTTLQATSPQAAMQIRAWKIARAVVAPVVMAGALNAALYGKNLPKNIPAGSIYLGSTDEQGKPRILDLLEQTQIRRGMRETGLQAVADGISGGLSHERIMNNAMTDVMNSALSLQGPPIRFVTTVAGGKLGVGRRGLMQTPAAEMGQSQLSVNIKEALKDVNKMGEAGIAAFENAKPGDNKPWAATKGAISGIANSAVSTTGRILGVKSVNTPPSAAADAMQTYYANHAPRQTVSEKDHSAMIRDLRAKLANGEGDEELHAALTSGDLTARSAGLLTKNAGLSPAAAQFKGLPLKEAKQVMEMATPEEKAVFAPLLERKELNTKISDLQAQIKMKQGSGEPTWKEHGALGPLEFRKRQMDFQRKVAERKLAVSSPQ